MSGVTRYRKAAHTRRIGRMKIPPIKRKVCQQCTSRLKGTPPIAWPLFSCQNCGAMCCEHLCGLKNGNSATCGKCWLESGRLTNKGTT